MLLNSKYFAVVQDAAAESNQSHRDLRAAYSGDGAWEQGHDVDPAVECEPPSKGAVCSMMEYYDFNPIMIQKWDSQAELGHPQSGTHSHFMWLG